MISAINDPRENNMALFIPSETEICMAATFRVPNGREPRKLTSNPVKNIFSNGGICRKYEMKQMKNDWGINTVL